MFIYKVVTLIFDVIPYTHKYLFIIFNASTLALSYILRLNIYYGRILCTIIWNWYLKKSLVWSTIMRAASIIINNFLHYLSLLYRYSIFFVQYLLSTVIKIYRVFRKMQIISTVQQCMSICVYLFCIIIGAGISIFWHALYPLYYLKIGWFRLLPAAWYQYIINNDDELDEWFYIDWLVSDLSIWDRWMRENLDRELKIIRCFDDMI